MGRGPNDVFHDVDTNIAYMTTRFKSFFAVDNTTGEVL